MSGMFRSGPDMATTAKLSGLNMSTTFRIMWYRSGQCCPACGPCSLSHIWSNYGMIWAKSGSKPLSKISFMCGLPLLSHMCPKYP